MALPRGIRQNNPFDLRIDNRWKWRGQVTGKNGFHCQFDTMENGIRAGARVLLTCYDTHNLDTVRKVVTRLASGDEKSAFVAAVADSLRVAPDTVLSLRNRNTLHMFVAAIGEYRNGTAAFRANVSDAQIIAGINAALSGR